MAVPAEQMGNRTRVEPVLAQVAEIPFIRCVQLWRVGRVLTVCTVGAEATPITPPVGIADAVRRIATTVRLIRIRDRIWQIRIVGEMTEIVTVQFGHVCTTVDNRQCRLNRAMTEDRRRLLR